MEIARLPRVLLGAWPTPLQSAPRLSAALGGPRILLKRDDVMPLGLGGNKTRKLEYLLGQALAEGADTVITTGAATSNHCRLTAAACCRLGLRAVLVLRSPEGRAPAPQGNLLLDRLLGAETRFVAVDGPLTGVAELEAVAAELRAAGRRPFVIPTGGSTGLGAIGYAHAMEEIAAQAPDTDVVVAAAGSGGTQAGLLLGARLHLPRARVWGVRVSPDTAAPLADRVRAVLGEAEALLDLPPAGQPVELIDGYVGPGYGHITDGVREAMRLIARTEGTFLDPVYTAKAMAGLIGEVRKGKLGGDQTVVFVHTGGGPEIFDRAAEVLEEEVDR